MQNQKTRKQKQKPTKNLGETVFKYCTSFKSEIFSSLHEEWKSFLILFCVWYITLNRKDPKRWMYSLINYYRENMYTTEIQF